MISAWFLTDFFSYLRPNMANTVNAALKPLETLSRIVNQPSSLFGGKGGSSKNKAEHDTVGAARASNSNTQGTTGDTSVSLCLSKKSNFLFSGHWLAMIIHKNPNNFTDLHCKGF